MQADDCVNGHWNCDWNGNRQCKTYWMGSNCNSKVISPSVDPECPNSMYAHGGCYNGGTCWKKSCCCPPGYTGQYCEKTVDTCANNMCANNATCIPTVSSYTCRCPAGYTGQYCNLQLNPCLNENACGPNGLCIVHPASPTGFYCNCLVGWTGPACSIVLDNCLSYPCKNGATCMNALNSYTCKCLAGFEGPDCSIQIDVCRSSPCKNGGACISSINQYICNCPHGYLGSDCSIVYDFCQ